MRACKASLIKSTSQSTYSKRISFSLTDAAGVLFFAHAFTVAHDLYEEICLKSAELKRIFLSRDFIVPIVHAEADFFHPLQAFDSVDCRWDVIHLGNSSFRSQVSMLKKTNLKKPKVCCVVRLTHVFVDKKSGQSRSIPPSIKMTLAKFASKQRRPPYAG